MTFTLGLAIGFTVGAAIIYGIMDKYVMRLAGERYSANEDARIERKRARNLHRRAQKAEGRLQRIDHILAEGDEE